MAHKWKEQPSGDCHTWLYECVKCSAQYTANIDQEGHKQTDYFPPEHGEECN